MAKTSIRRSGERSKNRFGTCQQDHESEKAVDCLANDNAQHAGKPCKGEMALHAHRVNMLTLSDPIRVAISW
jgi:hypothetical protein